MAHGYAMVPGGSRRSWCMSASAPPTVCAAVQRRARECADAVHRRPLALDRGGHGRRARRLHPLGAGDVRPGRDGARDRQMGLRTAQRPAARNRGRPRSRRRDQRAARARSICLCRARCWRHRCRASPTTCRAAASRHRRPVPTKQRSTRPRDSRRGGKSADHHRQRRSRSRGGRGAQRPRPALCDPGRAAPAAPSVACRRPSLPSRL